MLYYLNDSAARPQGDLGTCLLGLRAISQLRLRSSMPRFGCPPVMYVCVFNVQRLAAIYDWAILEMEDSPKLGELRFRSKTKAGPLEDKQLSRLGNIALVR